MSIRCDFCSEPEVVCIYQSPNHVMQRFDAGGQEIQHVATGGWAACSVCARLIDQADLRALANRAADLIVLRRPELKRHSREWLLGTVEPIHRKFFELREEKTDA